MMPDHGHGSPTWVSKSVIVLGGSSRPRHVSGLIYQPTDCECCLSPCAAHLSWNERSGVLSSRPREIYLALTQVPASRKQVTFTAHADMGGPPQSERLFWTTPSLDHCTIFSSGTRRA